MKLPYFCLSAVLGWISVGAAAGARPNLVFIHTNGLVGKWQLGDWTRDPTGRYHPTKHGFHFLMGLTGGGTSPIDAPLEQDGVVAVRLGLTDDVLTGEGIAFIERQRAQAFCQVLALRSPHAAWLPVAPEDAAPHANLDPTIPNPDSPDLNVSNVKRMMRENRSSVSGVDRNDGRVLAVLDRLKLADNTVVIFSSDHGYNMGRNGIWHKGNGIWATRKIPPNSENIAGKYRPNVYDHSLRVPANVRWPGVIPPGTVVTETCTSLDRYPTLIALAGARPPLGTLLRGRELGPLLRGERVPAWDNDFYAEYSMRVYCRTDIRASRTPQWKLVRDFLNPRRDELYDLQADPAEARNRIRDTGDPAVRAVVAVLDARIREQMRRNNDPLLARLQANTR